jgi:pimeloyl-ACP methyl ester carboxylesterase
VVVHALDIECDPLPFADESVDTIIMNQILERTIPMTPDHTWDDQHYVICSGRSCNGLEVTLTYRSGDGDPILLMDQTFGLPPEGEHLLQARPVTRVPAHDGDETRILQRMQPYCSGRGPGGCCKRGVQSMTTLGRRRGWKRWIARLFIGLLGIVVVLVVSGMTYESIAAAADRRTYPPPGQMVDVGGYRLHVHVMGQDRGKPTVILEHGGSAMSAQWGWVQPELAQHTRVVVYDRPGMGWSDAGPTRLEAQDAIRDLHTALQRLGVESPYILVGHSMGALMARVFAQSYPDEVVGLVLVDPRDVTWEGVRVAADGETERFARVMAVVSRLGIVRLSGMAAQEAEGLPPRQFEEGVALWSSYHHWKDVGFEGYLGDSAAALLQQGEDLQQLPLVVLSATDADGAFNMEERAGLIAQHTRLAARSSQGVHREVPSAGHATIVTQQQHAQAIADAVLQLLAASRQPD